MLIFNQLLSSISNEKSFLGDMSDLSLLKRESCCTVWKKQKYALMTKIRETNISTKEVKKAMILRKVFSLRVNFLFFHTVCSMLLFFNSMCVYPFFFSLKTFVDDALC